MQNFVIIGYRTLTDTLPATLLNMPHIKLIQTDAEFAGLEDAWRRLSEQSTTTSVFSSWDWQWLWWKHYGSKSLQLMESPERTLQILVLYEQQYCADNICAILPLYSQNIRFLKICHAQELRLIGTGGDTSPDYLGPLLLGNNAEQHLQLLCNAITTLPNWDTLNFSDLHDNPLFIHCLDKALAGHTISQTSSLCSSILYIDLDSDFNQYLSKLSSNQRKQIKRRRRRFEASGQTRFFVWPSDKHLDDAFSQLVRLHHLRWEEKSEEGSFVSESYLSFHRSVMDALHARDCLRLYCLEHDDEIIAMEYSYKWHNTIYSFQCGFNPQYQEHRPGQLLLNYSIENAIEEKLQQYDLLKGDYSYKRSAAKNQRNTLSYQAYRRNSCGLQLHIVNTMKVLYRRLKQD